MSLLVDKYIIPDQQNVNVPTFSICNFNTPIQYIHSDSSSTNKKSTFSKTIRKVMSTKVYSKSELFNY